MSDAGVIFLIHQGYSFINDLISLSDRLGLKSFVLCSKIPGDGTKRIEELQGLSTVFKETDSLALSNEDAGILSRKSIMTFGMGPDLRYPHLIFNGTRNVVPKQPMNLETILSL